MSQDVPREPAEEMDQETQTGDEGAASSDQPPAAPAPQHETPLTEPLAQTPGDPVRNAEETKTQEKTIWQPTRRFLVRDEVAPQRFRINQTVTKRKNRPRRERANTLPLQ